MALGAADSFNSALARLTKKLTNDIPKKAEAAVRAAMEQSANEIVATMKSFAPVDSGDLQMSINWCWGNAPKGTMVVGHVTGGKGKGARTFRQYDLNKDWRISIFAGGDDEYYAWFVEFGRDGMAAQPFFYPIWRAKRKGAKTKITRAVSKAVKEAAK